MAKSMARVIQGNYTPMQPGGRLPVGKVSDKVDLCFTSLCGQKRVERWQGEEVLNGGRCWKYVDQVGYDISDTQRITLSYDKLKDEGNYAPRPDFGKAYNLYATGNYLYPTEYTRETVALKHQVDLGDNLFLQTSIYSNENELERYEKRDGVTQRVRASLLNEPV